MNKYLPILIIVLSNIFYNVCTKSTPENVNPFASLVITYSVGAVVSFVLYLVTKGNSSILTEFGKINWTSWILGLSIVGLEAGFVYMYKAGWPISAGQLIPAALLAVCLIFVGALFYHEKITLTKVCGIVVCLFGLFLINKP